MSCTELRVKNRENARRLISVDVTLQTVLLSLLLQRRFQLPSTYQLPAITTREVSTSNVGCAEEVVRQKIGYRYVLTDNFGFRCFLFFQFINTETDKHNYGTIRPG